MIFYHYVDSSKHKIHFEDNCKYCISNSKLVTCYINAGMKGTRKAETFHINYIALAQVKVQNAINATIDVNIGKSYTVAHIQNDCFCISFYRQNSEIWNFS